MMITNNKNYSVFCISHHAFIGMFFFCLAGPLWGQANKKIKVPPSNYKQWHTLVPDQVSNDGIWFSYGLYYDTGQDTLVVQHVEKKVKYQLPNAFFSSFSSNSKWVFSRTRDHIFWMVNLHAGKEKKVPHVTRFWIAPNSQSVAYLVQKQAENKQYLVVENLQNRTTTTYAGVTESAYDASGRYLALVQKRQASTSVVVLDVHTNIAHTLYTSTKNNFSHLVWSPTGGRIAFFEHQANNTVVHAVQCVGNNPKKLNLFSDDLSIDVERRPALFFSDEGTQLFCYIKKTKKEPKAKKQKATTVEIWNTKDELLYPGYGYRKEKVENPSMMLAWQIEKNEWQMIGDSIHNTTLVGSKATYAYGYSNKTHSLSYAESEPQSTIELYNLVTGSQTSVVEKPHGFEFQMSPSGRYLAYFKQKHWWVYDAETNTHTNITASLKPHFFNKESKEINPSAAYGNPGWSADEKQILLYDKFDLWAITPEGKEAKRLTKGREQARIYRLYRLSQGRFEVPRFEAQYARFFDLKKGVVLSARDIYNEDTGYFHYTNKKGLEQIVFKDFAIKNLRMSKNKKTLIYTEERYNIPRRILRVKADDKKSVLVQSNRQHFNYKWGRAELVYYTNAKGEKLKGALFYPAGFNPNKKYPMITFCYERLSQNIHHYQNPTLHSSIGFSVSNYTTEGYFIFYPDIVYEVGNPGLSAVDCIVAGVNNVLEFPFIDKEKLGIYGHSFGGYETMFTITQTDMFATAVAGAGASDMLSYYLSMAWIWDRPQYWRFEHQQWRMGESYFKNPKAYERNSPIHQLQGVNTPLLSWAGKKDSNVNWQQHVEMFLGLRRLKKEHNMLLYPEEGHDITTPKSQVDLTNRIMQWFNYYLKDKSAPAWIVNSH